MKTLAQISLHAPINTFPNPMQNVSYQLMLSHQLPKTQLQSGNSVAIMRIIFPLSERQRRGLVPMTVLSTILNGENTFRDGPPFRVLATHMLDASYHFLNLNYSLSEKDQGLAIEMAGRWIAFANGEDPWKANGKERNAMCITDRCEFIARTEEEDQKRPERRWSKWEVVLDIGVEKIWKIISVYHAQFDMDEREVSSRD
jgi:hypothetical protein